MKKRGVHDVKMSQAQFWLDGHELGLSFFGWLNHSECQTSFFELLSSKKCRIILMEDLCYPENTSFLGFFSLSRFQCTPDMNAKIVALFDQAGYEITEWVYVRRTLLDFFLLISKYWIKIALVIGLVLAFGVYGKVTWETRRVQQKISVLQADLQREKQRHKNALEESPSRWKTQNQKIFYTASMWSHVPGSLSRLWVSAETIQLSGYCLPPICGEVHTYIEGKLAAEKRPLKLVWGELSSLGTAWELQDQHENEND